MPFEYCYSLQGFGFLFVLFCFVLFCHFRYCSIDFIYFWEIVWKRASYASSLIFFAISSNFPACLFYHLALSFFFTFSLILSFFFLIPRFLSSSFLPSHPYSLVFLFFFHFFLYHFCFPSRKKNVCYSNFSDYRSVFEARKRAKKIWNSSRVREHQKQKSQEVFFYQYLLEFFRLADSLHFEITVSEGCWEREKS